MKTCLTGLTFESFLPREDNDFSVYVMIKRLVWTTWTLLSAIPKRLLNLISHSFTWCLGNNINNLGPLYGGC